MSNFLILVIIHFTASWYLSVVLFAGQLQDSLILPRGYFFVQTPFSFITGMLPRYLNKKTILFYLRIAPYSIPVDRYFSTLKKIELLSKI
ncbi:hypothetical protein BIV60_00315 [Bacillus sp. MUM 116]|nr:hypothetical protein BIV60_00315 [Bacillus sp. MUM 116]